MRPQATPAPRRRGCSSLAGRSRGIEKQPAGVRPSWSAVARSSEQGKRRRITGKAMEQEKEVMGDGYDYELSGVFYTGALEIIKSDYATGAWITKPGFRAPASCGECGPTGRTASRRSLMERRGREIAASCMQLAGNMWWHFDAGGDHHGREQLLERLPLQCSLSKSGSERRGLAS